MGGALAPPGQVGLRLFIACSIGIFFCKMSEVFFFIFFSHRNLMNIAFKCDCKIEWIWAEMKQKVHHWKQDVIGLNKFNSMIKANSMLCRSKGNQWKKITDIDIGFTCSKSFTILYHRIS